MNPHRPHLTRLAPSPTGALHLGNARTFLANWLLARQRNWQILLRIEDLDGPRVRQGADQQAIQDLHSLGLDWDQGPVYQSTRQRIYDAAVHRLLAAGSAYPCICTRRDARLAAAAPHDDDAAAIYPGTCSDRFTSIEEATQQAGRPPAIRFRVRPGIVNFQDQFRGPISIDAEKTLGDPVIRKSDGTAAYQLAVVIDDAESNVDQIVRGDDLINSTAWQLLLYDALKIPPPRPTFTHLPLVLGPDGRRLAKRHGDSRLSHYRQKGVPIPRLLALLAQWLGMPDARPQTAADLLPTFDLARVPRNPITHDAATERFLLDPAAS